MNSAQLLRSLLRVTAVVDISGGCMWIMAGDGRRYGPMIRFNRIAHLILGVALLVIDFRVGLRMVPSACLLPTAMSFIRTPLCEALG